MSWYDELSEDCKAEVNMLCGTLDLPLPKEYETLAHFLHAIRAAHVEVASLIRQAAILLGV